MGYHIFMARKVQLTTLKNNAYANMMNAWVEQEHLADDKLQEMKTKNNDLKSLNQSYDADVDTIYKDYEGKDAGEQINGMTRDQALDKAKREYQNKRDAIEDDYSVNYQSLTDDETALEKEIQILETNISEYTQEMSKAEQQEATEIKTCIPNYNGAGGGQ